MREIVLDTETTGLDPYDGHRIIEVCCLELDNHLPTGKVYHTLIHPERDIPEETARVHGLTIDKLEGAPVFAGIVDELLAFIGDAPLVIHNAEFDLKFLNAEFARLSRPALPAGRGIDTIAIAKRRFPGSRYSLDELCRRFNIDLSARAKHGARIDVELLAQVYLELVGGRQARLVLAPGDSSASGMGFIRIARPRPQALPPRLRLSEGEAHAQFIAAELQGDVIWSWGPEALLTAEHAAKRA
jgi:DNA polymerase III subunit epsilon